MSGVLKAIGKVFKKVVSVVKKVLPYALMIGAVVLTGGAAIGALPALGTMIGGLGLSTGVTAALTTAVSSAAIGSGLGAAKAALTGGNILKGAAGGAVAGFATGGLLGAAGALGSGAGAASTGIKAGLEGAKAGIGSAVSGGAGAVANGMGSAINPGAVSLPASVAVPGVTAAAGGAGRGILSSLSNPMVLGPLITGVGSGISNYAVSRDQAKLVEDDRKRIADNYGGGVGLLSRGMTISQDRNRPTPTQRFDPNSYGGQWIFDPQQGRTVFVPNAQTGTGG